MVRMISSRGWSNSRVPSIAVALHAHYFEVHFHLASEPSVLEANVSWDEHEFAALVDSVRHTEHLLG